MNIKDLRTFISELKCKRKKLWMSRKRKEISFFDHKDKVEEITKTISATETLICYLK